MLMAEENTENWLGSGDLCEGFEDLDKFSIDIESLYEILSEESEGPTQNHSQSSPEELSCRNTFDGEATLSEINHGSSQSQNGVQIYDAPQVGGGLAGSSACCPEELEVTDARSEMASECMFEFPVNSGMVFDNMNMDSACHFDSPLHTCSVSLGDWSTSYVENDTCSSRENHFYNAENTTINQIPNCGFKFTAGDTTHASGSIYHENIVHLKVDDGNDFKRVEGDYHSKCASHFPTTRGSCSTFEDDNAMIGRSTEDLVGPVRNLPTSNMDITFSYAETPLQNALPSEINDNQAYDSNECSMGSFSECFDTVTDSENLADSSGKFSPCRFEFPFFESEEGNMGARVELELLPSESMCTNSRTDLEAQAVASISVVPDSPLMVHTETKNCQDSLTRPSTSYCSTTRGKASYNAHGNKPVNASNQLVSGLHSFISSKDLVTREDKRVDKLHASESVSSQSENIANDAFEGYHSAVSKSSVFSDEFGPFVDHSLSYLVPDSRSLMSSKRLKIYVKDEKKDKVIPPRSIGFQSAKFSGQVIKSSSSVYSYQLDDDPDICILEDISDPRHPKPAVGNGKSLVISNHSSSDLYLTGSAGTRLFNTNDERLTYRVALQDLSQPTVEATPPNGVLAVPLMRHQRIALSWMVQKETSSLQCSGGILADDQGLGKTISTIALILKERPPSKMSLMTVKQDDTKALNLDDDDDDTGVCQLDRIKQEDGESDHKSVNKCSVKSENASILSKGRPSAGTLIVCPTSVLRQWAEELHNKVTKEANLSVLVYHGSNRTKDPLELVKYDVVVTTYSIVSMEVPKQPLGDKDDDERVKSEEHVLSPTELSCKKRKYPPSSTKKSKKDKKGTDSSLLDSAARPLARVGWFRVVLDEAQSIKNHRTQVARACWGLRAKRRWCLSGTPIQNAVDDLYSYFRFLRYDPYAVYKSFCSMIKVPITRNPTTGYKKLQAVLKTIMLRRTKGTKIDGEPIICLPPKSVELKKVDFSLEEREFYSKLEADSRAQFNVYAAAGTVQQNYVNILLMLLRLRQACDHPFLVKGYDSTSLWSSSLEMAKKLPKEKQTNLLSCLEACLAICGICNDSPEEAVVTICGHVFCNQCISEHLTGDDNLCPATQCKVHLNATSVFSSATLKSSLFDQSQHDMCAPQIDEALDSCSEGFYSSKIRAALEVLESLSKPESCNPRLSCLKSSNEVARFPGAGNMCDAYAGDTVDKRIVNIENGFDSSSTKKAEKAIVFSQWTRMLDLLEARLKTSSIQYRRLDGTMSVVARDKAVKDFNTLPEVTVMIMSLKAASLGLNMVAACHVLLLDLWWNPTTEDQAIDRAHRIGQTRPVTVLRLTVKDTVEDRILALQQKKREMVASAFGEDETGSRQTRLTVDDLRYLFTGADH